MDRPSAGGTAVPSTELEREVLEAFEFPRAIGDILFLRPALKEAGRGAVEAAATALESAGLVEQPDGSRLWSLTASGALWLSETAPWQVRCDHAGVVAEKYYGIRGRVDQGLVSVGDWWHDGCGVIGSVVGVDSWDAESRMVGFRVEASGPLELPLVLRWIERLAGGGDVDGDAEALLALPASVAEEWAAQDWESDLLFDRSLPDITAQLADGRTWDDVHTAVLQSDLRWEYSHASETSDALPPASEVFGKLRDTGPHLLKVWVGPLQFNAHYFDETEVDFDIEVAVVGDPAAFECLVAFMDWMAVIAGTTALMEHEGHGPTIRASQVPADRATAVDAIRLADLRNPDFGEYRGVIAPGRRRHEGNIDRWLENYDADATSAVLSHVHMYDTVESVDDEVALGRLAQQVAQRWREVLADQFPDRSFVVGVIGEPDEYGPTVWLQVDPTST